MLDNSLASTLVEPLPGVSMTDSLAQVPSNPSAAPPAQVIPKKKASTEPLTISLKSGLLRKTRILAASRGISLSKLIACVMADAVRRDLPAVAANLADSSGDDQ